MLKEKYTVPDWKRDAYWLLKNLRNAMAHGTPPAFDAHRQLVQNPERLAKALEATLNRLTNTLLQACRPHDTAKTSIRYVL